MKIIMVIVNFFLKLSHSDHEIKLKVKINLMLIWIF